jgi:hypothetical protein
MTPCILLRRRQDASCAEKYQTAFSIREPQEVNHGSRVIVDFRGVDTGFGVWSCSHCGIAICNHVEIAATHMKPILELKRRVNPTLSCEPVSKKGEH